MRWKAPADLHSPAAHLAALYALLRRFAAGDETAGERLREYGRSLSEEGESAEGVTDPGGAGRAA